MVPFDESEIHFGSKLDVETMLPPGSFYIVFAFASGVGSMQDVEIAEGTTIHINEGTAEFLQ